MSIWGKLASRYEGGENRKHRLLALDGGGIRGILTLEVLHRMEKMLAEATGLGAAVQRQKPVLPVFETLISGGKFSPDAHYGSLLFDYIIQGYI